MVTIALVVGSVPGGLGTISGSPLWQQKHSLGYLRWIQFKEHDESMALEESFIMSIMVTV